MSDDLERLIQDRLDGEATSGDRRLVDALERDPAAVERLRRAEVVFEAMRSMDLEEPPPDLVPGVVAAIARQNPMRPRQRRGSRLSLVFTFAAGVVVGGLGWLAMDRVGFDGPASQLGGTVPVSRDHAMVDRQTIPLEPGEVQLQSRREGDRVTLRVETRVAGGRRVRVSFDPASLTLVSFRRESAGTVLDPVVFDERHLELQAAPRGVYTLVFRSGRTPPPVEVSVEGPAGWVSQRVQVSLRSGSQPRPPK